MRYAIYRGQAFRSAQSDLRPVLGVPLEIAEWSDRFRAMYEDQWVGHSARRTGWDWPEINRRYRDPDGLNAAISYDGRLSGLLVATASRRAVTLNYFEADPRPDCPLKGKRILIALDVAARYAQARGREELRVEPLDPSLERLCCEVYGFLPVRPRKGVAYFARKV